MGDFKVDKDAFKRRMKKLYAAWKEASEGDPLNQVDALVVAVGTADVVYSKSISVQTWLFGYELPDTIMALCKSSIIVLSSKKKINFVQQVEGSSKDGSIPSFKLLVRDKNDKDTSNIQTIINAIKASSKGKTIGVLSKDKFPSDLLDSWKKAIDEAAFEKVDISAPIALVMAPKEDPEVSLIKKACNATMDLYEYVRQQLGDIIYNEKQVEHSKLAGQIENKVRNSKYYSTGLDVSCLDVYYTPILQSGGKYKLKFSAKVGDNILHFGSIVCMLGLRYKSYCSNIARTLMVGPTQEMQANYALLLKAQDAAITALRHGVKLSEVYEAAVKAIKSEKPELVDKSTKNAGFGMGLRFREASMLISAESEVVAVKGMVFNLNLGFSDLLNKEAKDDEGKNYSLFIGDTVLVNDENVAATVLTPKNRQDNAFEFVKTRKEMSAKEKQKQQKQKLAENVQREALEQNAGHREKEDENKNRKVTVSYKNENDFPSEPEISELKVYVDKEHETVVVPFQGKQVPFHIATIKNISKSVEEDHTILRINFLHPNNSSKRKERLPFPKTYNCYLQNMVLRSSNSRKPGDMSSAELKRAHNSIKKVLEEFKRRKAEEREKEGLVKQDSVTISFDGPFLLNVYIKPKLGSKKLGMLKSHKNGFIYTCGKDKCQVEILFNNIKTAFFKKCDETSQVILIHYHLKDAILINKKKCIDVQFYKNVGKVFTDLKNSPDFHDSGRNHAEEKYETKKFQEFCDKVSGTANITFETPVTNFGFTGTSKDGAAFNQPTQSCLVNLTEWPPFIVTMDEVEVVYLERVQFQLKSFDMVFAFKDYHKKVAMITAVPSTELHHVKDWLEECNTMHFESTDNKNWTKIMKNIANEPGKFYEKGGWKALDSGSREENEDEDDDDDDEDDTYRPSDSGSEEESSEGDSEDSNWSAEDDDDEDENDTYCPSGSGSEEESSEGDSEDSNWSAEDDDDEDEDDTYRPSDSGSEEESSEGDSEDSNWSAEEDDDELRSSDESGKDWDELEEEAKRADKHKNKSSRRHKASQEDQKQACRGQK